MREEWVGVMTLFITTCAEIILSLTIGAIIGFSVRCVVDYVRNTWTN